MPKTSRGSRADATESLNENYGCAGVGEGGGVGVGVAGGGRAGVRRHQWQLQQRKAACSFKIEQVLAWSHSATLTNTYTHTHTHATGAATGATESRSLWSGPKKPAKSHLNGNKCCVQTIYKNQFYNVMRSELAHQPVSECICVCVCVPAQYVFNSRQWMSWRSFWCDAGATLGRLLAATATRQPLTQLPATSQSKSFAHNYEARRWLWNQCCIVLAESQMLHCQC